MDAWLRTPHPRSRGPSPSTEEPGTISALAAEHRLPISHTRRSRLSAEMDAWLRTPRPRSRGSPPHIPDRGGRVPSRPAREVPGDDAALDALPRQAHPRDVLREDVREHERELGAVLGAEV